MNDETDQHPSRLSIYIHRAPNDLDLLWSGVGTIELQRAWCGGVCVIAYALRITVFHVF